MISKLLIKSMNGTTTGTLLKVINSLLGSSFIRTAEGCNIIFEGVEQRPPPGGYGLHLGNPISQERGGVF
jgi:hypothetical protein